MRGFIYNNPKLAYDGVGFMTYDGINPHAHWCVLRQYKDGDVLLAPVWFDYMDNLSNSIIESCPLQIEDSVQAFTVGIGRCIRRFQEEITTEPIMFLNPIKAKEIYKVYRRAVNGR